MSVAQHRKQVFENMEDNSIAVVFAGIPLRSNEDDYYPFSVNSQFFWLTGLEREKMILLLIKNGGENKEILFIEEPDPFMIRWTGRMPSKEDASAVSGIERVEYVSDFESTIDMLMSREIIGNFYFDTSRLSMSDLPDYNLVKANEFKAKYPNVTIRSLYQLVCPLRRVKDADEIEEIKQAINITREGLNEVLHTLKPGMKEYQVQANFEYRCHYMGATAFAFPTIAGSGANGCMMHYGENDADVVPDGLILLDLGAKYHNYCSDITRTYPVSGKYSPRQRQYYELVLKANRAVKDAAKPGMTTADLQKLTCKILAEGLIEMGKIEKPEEISKYYMHGVSHSMGIDCHDINLGKAPMEPGWVISDEPGLYIDEEAIGIRIEDDLLITEDGCICLSEAIPRDPDEIEAIMAEQNA